MIIPDSYFSVGCVLAAKFGAVEKLVVGHVVGCRYL